MPTIDLPSALLGAAVALCFLAFLRSGRRPPGLDLTAAHKRRTLSDLAERDEARKRAVEYAERVVGAEERGAGR